MIAAGSVSLTLLLRVTHFACALPVMLCLHSLAEQAFAEDAATANLIANGNFEADKDDDRWPDGWGKLKAGGTWEAEEDNHFLRMHATQPGETVLLYHPQRLPADVKAVELSWRWRISELKTGKQSWHDARIMLGFLDAENKKLSGAPGAPNVRKGTDGWQEKSMHFLVPADAQTLEIMPTLMQVDAGTFDLDDISLRAVDPAPLEAAAKAAAEARAAKIAKDAAARHAKAAKLLEETGSLISNGNFETNNKKAADQAADWGLPKTGGSWETEDGSRFLRLASTEPGQMVMVYRLIDLPADVEAVELTWRQRVSEIKPGKFPWFDARIMMNLKDAAGKKMAGGPGAPATRKSTEGWVEKSTKFLIPKGALTIEFMPALFQVDRGTFDLDDLALRPTDAEPLRIAAAKRAEEERLANVPVEEPQRDKWPLELHVEGNKVINSAGQQVVLRGVNVVSLEFLLRGDHVLKSCQVAVDDWKSNIVRLPVKESYWFGREPGQTDGGEAYRQLVDDAITMVANRGAYVLLDLHRFRAPKAEHVEFWTSAATKYKNHPAVLFDVFNEPHGMSWEIWRDGGRIVDKKKPADEDAFLTPEEKAKNDEGFESVGMQKLIDAVRATGAKNIVVPGGLDWAYDLSGVADGYELNQGDGNGLIYSTHIYPWKFNWKEKVLCIADKYPILVGEVGCDIKKMSFIPPENQEDPYTWGPDMLGFMQEHGLHWTAFSFHPTASPVMISDWHYTPTPFWGAMVKRALAGEKFPLKKER